MDNRGILSYKNLATCVQGDDKLDFLHNIVPKKITVREYKKILAEEKVPNFDSEGSDESSSEESGSEEESEEESGSDDEKPEKK
jgi:chromatin accessibility complex protein 1